VGNVVDPLTLRERFGTDAVRWYLMREMPTGSDASYTPERFMARYDELANVLGNLASRVIAMISKYRDGVVPDGPGRGLDEAVSVTFSTAREAMGRYRVHDALGSAMDLARTANGYVEERQPWAQAKSQDPGPLDETLGTLARVLVALCALFQPVAPARMADLSERLGLDGVPTLEEALTVVTVGRQVRKGDPLFPKVQAT
jgi:methionyl-tRNA synthetase